MNTPQSHSRISQFAATALATGLAITPAMAAEKTPEQLRNDTTVNPVFAGQARVQLKSAYVLAGGEFESAANEKVADARAIPPRKQLTLGFGMRASKEFSLGVIDAISKSTGNWQHSFGPSISIMGDDHDDYVGLSAGATFNKDGLQTAYGDLRHRDDNLIIGADLVGDQNFEKNEARWCMGPKIGYGLDKAPVEFTVGAQVCDSGFPDGTLSDVRVPLMVDFKLDK